MLVFALGMMVVLLIMAAFAVDIAYMQLTRTELRAATDAAAKAGCEALLREQSPDAGVARAIEIANENLVAGNRLQIARENIEFGQSELQPDGSWLFTPGARPFRALRINVQMGAGQRNGPVGLFFGHVLGVQSFSPSASSTASELEQELCFCLDRSHSMCFDLSGVDFRYPPPIRYLQGLNSPPHPTGSRWAALVGAVDEFVDVYSGLDTDSRLAMVTWATREGNSPEVSLDAPLGTPPANLHGLLAARGSRPMLGGTNISAGIERGVEVLTGPGTRPLSKKILIVMTDGEWNAGRDPVEAARDAHEEGIIIHTITFLPGARQDEMVEVAAVTGGKHFYADDAAALREAFRYLALTLPVVLTQ
jgi:hypothetical protein